MLLYHGSCVNIKERLKPHKAFEREDYQECVYLTDRQELALLYAINPIKAYIDKHYHVDLEVSATSAHILCRNYVFEVFELYPDMFKDLFNQEAYIYVVDNQDEYVQGGDNEYIIKTETKYKEKIIVPNLYKELLNYQVKGLVKLYSFNEVDSWNTYFEYDHIESSLQSRAKYCKSQYEIEFFKMLSNHYNNIIPTLISNKNCKN